MDLWESSPYSQHLAEFICTMPCLTDCTWWCMLPPSFYSSAAALSSSSKARTIHYPRPCTCNFSWYILIRCHSLSVCRMPLLYTGTEHGRKSGNTPPPSTICGLEREIWLSRGGGGLACLLCFSERFWWCTRIPLSRVWGKIEEGKKCRSLCSLTLSSLVREKQCDPPPPHHHLWGGISAHNTEYGISYTRLVHVYSLLPVRLSHFPSLRLSTERCWTALTTPSWFLADVAILIWIK